MIMRKQIKHRNIVAVIIETAVIITALIFLKLKPYSVILSMFGWKAASIGIIGGADGPATMLFHPLFTFIDILCIAVIPPMLILICFSVVSMITGIAIKLRDSILFPLTIFMYSVFLEMYALYFPAFSYVGMSLFAYEPFMLSSIFIVVFTFLIALYSFRTIRKITLMVKPEPEIPEFK